MPWSAASGDEHAWPSAPGRLFYITDNSSNFKFLTDTRAQVSVILPTFFQRKHRHSGFQLQAVNSSSVATYENQTNTILGSTQNIPLGVC